INCGNAQWHASANTYTLRVEEINAGEITANDTTVNYDYAPITIQGDEIAGAEYQWKINGEVVAESNVQNYIISAGLCPDSVYNFTREVKINCGNAQWHASANTYTLRVEINAGEITTNDTTVKHNYEPITIQGDEIVGAAYQWKKNGEVIAESNVQNYTIPTGLCPDDYTFTREVKIAVCEQSQWLPSANSYKLTVEINPGEIVSKDTSITTGESLTIEGDNLGEGTSYQWLKNGVDIEGATEQNYILSAENLCPGEQFIFTRQISINECIGATATSANEYKVMISVGAIEAKDITVDPGYVATIDADNLPGVQYQWYLNGSEIPDATEYNYQITELCEIGEYVFTRKVKGAECANWYNSENEYKVTVKAIAGKIDADAIYVCSDLTGKQIGSIEDAQGDVVVYSWKYNKNDGEWINADTNRNSLTEADLNAICADAASEDVYAFQRYAKIGCMSNPVASEGTAKIYFSSTSGDELVAHDMSYHFNYGEDFLWRDSLLLPDLIHNGEIRPSDWVYEINAPAEKIYPAPGTNKATITWSITDKCGATFNATQTITFLLPACGDEYTVTDVDGNEYASVRIGLDCWMAENLKTTHYADGTLVPNVRSYKGHKDYPDTVQNAQTFGLLYTWNAVMKNTTPATADEMVQGICPDDWALPTAAYFERMMPVDVKTLRTTDYWLVANGTNTTGFSMLPAGRYNDVHNRCENLLGNAYFWSSTTYNNTEVKTFEADCHCYKWQEVSNPKTAGLSLRCVRVKFEPIVISTDSATNLTKTSATLNGTVSSLGDYDELNVGFKYGANVHVLTSIVALEDAITAPDEFSYDIDGLTPNTRYYYRAFATSGMDTVWGALKSFITPVIAVTTDSANTVTKNSAKLHGTVISLGEYSEVNAGFKYGTSESTLTSIVVKDAAMTATGLFSCDIDGLNDNTKYYFKAFAANGTDTVYGEVKDFTTTGSSTFTCGTDSVKDVDNNWYHTVKIGNQCWMAENMRCTTSPSGKLTNGGTTITPDKCYYYIPTSNVPSIGTPSSYTPEEYVSTFGLLYNFMAAVDSVVTETPFPAGLTQGICPEGWHIPTKAEFTTLTGVTGWTTAFDPLLAGGINGGGFHNVGEHAYFWADSIYDQHTAYYLYHNGYTQVQICYPSDGYSVRCLRDLEVPASVTTDSANTVTSNSAKLYGNVTSMGSYTEVNAGFKYGTSESTLTSIASDGSAMFAAGQFSYTITGLTANTQYYFKAFAANGTDTVYGEVKNFTTPVMAVTTDSASTITYNSAKLYANVKNMGGMTSLNAGFKYGTSASALTSIVTKSDAVTATGSYNCEITGLTSNTIYYYKAFAANGTDTVWGEVKNFTSAFACGDTVKDVENNKYKTVEIGTQCWMAENLKTTHYANGNTWQNQIQTVTTATTSSNGCCYRPGNADTNVPTYGYLYNWHAVANTSNGGLCPTGWHVPTDAEWTTMTDYVGNQSGYQCNHQKANIAKALASKSNWNSSTGGGTTCNVGNDLTTNNATGFSALPAGTFSGSDTRFENLKSATRFWTATGSGSNATCRIMEYNSANVTSKNNVGKTSAYSVRCVKD
ncbi:MAG: hypothetical protein MJZ52_01080, partial [Bacteroidales bacterium]|nr:hypothetical protein [Bacteroidales bacterium]